MVGAVLQLVVFVYRFILQGETDYISTNPLTTSSSSIIIKQQCISGQVLRATSKRAKPQGIRSRFERQYCATIIGACGLGMQQRAIPPVYHSFQASTSKSKWNSRPSQHSFLIENPILAVKVNFTVIPLSLLHTLPRTIITPARQMQNGFQVKRQRRSGAPSRGECDTWLLRPCHRGSRIAIASK